MRELFKFPASDFAANTQNVKCWACLDQFWMLLAALPQLLRGGSLLQSAPNLLGKDTNWKGLKGKCHQFPVAVWVVPGVGVGSGVRLLHIFLSLRSLVFVFLLPFKFWKQVQIHHLGIDGRNLSKPVWNWDTKTTRMKLCTFLSLKKKLGNSQIWGSRTEDERPERAVLHVWLC